MQNRTPQYRYSFWRPVPGGDQAGISIAFRRVDGDPDGGSLGCRTSPVGTDLDLILADLRQILEALPAADDPAGVRPDPVRDWVFDPWNGPLVMKGPPA